MIEQTAKVKYKNYRGEVSVRTIIPKNIFFGKTDYHKEEQWLLKVWDVEKNSERVYALKDVLEWL